MIPRPEPLSPAGCRAAASDFILRRMTRPTSSAPVLLSGGDPRIAKGEGDAPVQACIAAMPDWKSAV